MSKLDRVFAGGLFAAGLAVVVGYGISQTSPAQAQAADGPGPNLVIEVAGAANGTVGSSRVDLQACKLEYSIVSPK